MAKITKSMFEVSGYTPQALAAAFGVSPKSVDKVTAGESPFWQAYVSTLRPRAKGGLVPVAKIKGGMVAA
jgi:hypothetical protein